MDETHMLTLGFLALLTLFPHPPNFLALGASFGQKEKLSERKKAMTGKEDRKN